MNENVLGPVSSLRPDGVCELQAQAPAQSLVSRAKFPIFHFSFNSSSPFLQSQHPWLQAF